MRLTWPVLALALGAIPAAAHAQSEAFVRPGVHATVDAMIAPGATEVGPPVNTDVDGDGVVDALLQLDADGRVGLVLARHTDAGWTGALVTFVGAGTEHEIAWDSPVTLGGHVYLVVVHAARGGTRRASTGYLLYTAEHGAAPRQVFADETRDPDETWVFNAAGDGSAIVVTSSRRRARTLTPDPESGALSASAWWPLGGPSRSSSEASPRPRRGSRH